MLVFSKWNSLFPDVVLKDNLEQTKKIKKFSKLQNKLFCSITHYQTFLNNLQFVLLSKNVCFYMIFFKYTNNFHFCAMI
jgi:hypothetical protein